MTRRLLFVMVGTALVIVVASGLGMWILARQSARTHAVSDVTASVQSLGSTLLNETVPVTGKKEFAFVRKIIRGAARADEADLLAAPSGVVASNPTVVPSSLLDEVAQSSGLGNRTLVSGSTGNQAWAVERVEITYETARRVGALPRVLVLTRTIDTTGLPGGFFIVAGAVVLFAVVVSLALGRQITRPLRRAVATTQRIAAGDLGARVGTHRGDLPELWSLAASIDAMAAGLGRARTAEREFLLSVSHDLRTPLTSIRGYAEAIVDGTAPDPARAAAVISNESRRLERLVGDLLDLAKLDARTFSFHIRVADVAEVLEEVAEELRPVVTDAGLQLIVHPAARPALARVDPDRLDQVLANLVENAAKFATTTVRLGTVTNGSETQLVVEDDGPGIPPPELGRVFDRHYSVDRHARPGRPKGSGLGLAIAAELSSAMGAAVIAQSPITPLGGTRMVVRVPTVPSQSPHTFPTPA